MSDTTKILFLSATPDDRARLRTDQELRDVTEGLLRVSQRDKFELIPYHAMHLISL